MFADGVAGSGQKDEDGLPIVDVDGEPLVPESCLVQLHPSMVDLAITEAARLEACVPLLLVVTSCREDSPDSRPDAFRHARLCALADKYESRPLLLSLIPYALDANLYTMIRASMAMLALSIIYGAPQQLCQALRAILGDYTIQALNSNRWKYRKQGPTLQHIPDHLWRKSGLLDIGRCLLSFSTRLLNPAMSPTSWAYVADEIIKVRPPHPRIAAASSSADLVTLLTQDAETMNEVTFRLAGWCRDNALDSASPSCRPSHP